ncbi:MAG: hypothetical protein GY787_10140 [Alteromonadales bacterium]|nr:hypothetical protein [Alteromonadales bacterium]
MKVFISHIIAIIVSVLTLPVAIGYALLIFYVTNQLKPGEVISFTGDIAPSSFVLALFLFISTVVLYLLIRVRKNLNLAKYE